MLVQPPSTASSMMKVVSSTIIAAMPSTPIVNRIPQLGIQGLSTTADQSAEGSTLHQRPSETTNSTTKVAIATMRGNAALPEATSSPEGSWRPVTPRIQMTSAPMMGMTNSAGRIQLLYPMERRKSFIDQRMVKAPSTASTPSTSTQA